MANNCTICGEPMPEGETMFKFHGYSGNCPKPPLPRKMTKLDDALAILKMIAETDGDEPARSQHSMHVLARDFFARHPQRADVPMKPHWTSFELPGKLRPKFEYHGPWWISGQSGADDSDDIVCAWVMATDAEAATETLRLAIDADARPDAVEERFSSEKPMPDRSNPSGRFEFADWMKWPWPIKPMEPRP